MALRLSGYDVFAEDVFADAFPALDARGCDLKMLPRLVPLARREDGEARRQRAAHAAAARRVEQLVVDAGLHRSEARACSALVRAEIVAVAHAPERSVLEPQLGVVVEDFAHGHAA